MKDSQMRLLSKVAHMYYKQEMKQGDIAHALGVERSTISKYLKKAKELGIITIEIRNNELQLLEFTLESKYGLREASIILADDDADNKYDSLGRAGGELLQRLIRPNMTIGFNWGRSMLAISQYLSTSNNSSVRADFVPLVGGCNHTNIQLHGNTICMKVAQSFNARCHNLYAPVITSTVSMKDAIINDEAFQSIFKLWERLDIAFVGIGAPQSSSNVIWNENLRSDDIGESVDNNLVGETCTRFYDRAGQEVVTPLFDRTISIDLDQLRKVKYVIGLAAGREKVEAITAALEGKLINVLVTDDITARLLI